MFSYLPRRSGLLPLIIAFGLLTFVSQHPKPLFATELDLPPIDASHLPPRTTVLAPDAAPVPQWLHDRLRLAHLPGYDDVMVKGILNAGYNVVSINALARWDRVGPAAVLYTPKDVSDADAYLKRDVDTVHAAGAKAIFYVGPVQVPLFSKEFARAHPDWLTIRPDGKPYSAPNWANIRSPYGEWLCDQLAYVTKTYHVDGFWFDGYAPPQVASYDADSEKQFRAISGGKNMPTTLDLLTDPVARQYVAWQEQFFVDFAQRMRQAIRAVNPETVIFVNHSGPRTWWFPDQYMGEYPLAYSRVADVSSIELYWDIPGDALYQQFCFAFMQDITHGRAATAWVQPAEHGTSGISSPVEIRLRGLEGLPWGVYSEFVESTGRVEYARLHEQDIAAREQFCQRSEPVPYIGIVASEQTRRLYARGNLPLYFSHTLGAFRALFEKHWPVRVLSEYDLEDADLAGVRVLVLPNVACLSDRAAEVVRRFVRAGGGLVATMETSLYTADAQRRPDFALGDLLRAKYLARHAVNQRSENVFLTLQPHPITDDPLIRAKQPTYWNDPPGSNRPFPLIANCAIVQPSDGGQVIATFQSEPQQDPGKPSSPAIIASEFGKGRVVYFPAGVDQAMFFYPDSYQRQLLANAVRWAAHGSPPPVEVEGPLLLAATFRRQPEDRRIIVHLLNDHSSYGRHSIYQKLAPLPKELSEKYGYPSDSELRGTWPIREEVIPLHDIKVRCRLPNIRRATQQPEGIPLELHSLADAVEVIVPEVQMHSMVVFETK